MMCPSRPGGQCHARPLRDSHGSLAELSLTRLVFSHLPLLYPLLSLREVLVKVLLNTSFSPYGGMVGLACSHL